MDYTLVVLAIFFVALFGRVITLRLTKRVQNIHLCCVSMISAVVLVSPIFYEYSNFPNSEVVTFNGDRIVRHPHGTFVWEWGNYSNVPLKFNPNREPVSERNLYFTAIGSVTIITDNPKTRQISYRGMPYLVSPEKYFQKSYRKTYGFSEDIRVDMTKVVDYWFYEFNEKNSKQLAQFYNPKDFDQQKRFIRLLVDWMNKRLVQEGIAVEIQSFSF